MTHAKNDRKMNVELCIEKLEKNVAAEGRHRVQGRQGTGQDRSGCCTYKGRVGVGYSPQNQQREA